MAHQLAREVEAVLQGDKAYDFLSAMYGDQPNYWDNHWQGVDRWRCITNYFTRMRFCYVDGSLALKIKGSLQQGSEQLIPWFALTKCENVKILFGHWAALGGVTQTKNIYALDTGCVWGNYLTAMRIEDEQRFQIKCLDKLNHR